MTFGICLSSLNWNYLTDEATLQKILGACKDAGMKEISVHLHWDKIETSRQVYDDAFLDRIVAIGNLAKTYGLSVIPVFHTLHQAGYHLPSFIVPNAFSSVVLDAGMRFYWLRMVQHVVQYLESRLTNIHSWHLLNEPITETGITTPAQFVTLFQLTKQFAATMKPVSIRFGVWSFSSYWMNQPAIYPLLDYITINYYEEYHSLANLQMSIRACVNNSKPIRIGEFGQSGTDDTVQTRVMASTLATFKTLKVLDGCVWHMGDYEGGLGFNLLMNDMIRPAFNELAKANMEQPPPGGGFPVVLVGVAASVALAFLLVLGFSGGGRRG